MATSLYYRLKAFLDSLDDAEDIDASISEDAFARSQRADYLLQNRQIILEIKSIESNPQYKVEEKLSTHRERSEYPEYYWPSDLNEILSHLPDGEEIRRQIAKSVIRPVQGAIEKADDQIQATRSALGLPDACGVVALLNQQIDLLSPTLITAAANQMLLKRRNGSIRYTNIAYVWIMSETHRLERPGGTEHLPLILLEGPTAEHYPEVGTYLDDLQRQWANHQGNSFSSLSKIDTFDGLEFTVRSAHGADVQPEPLSRHELWRCAYRGTPYMRRLSEEEFLNYMANVIKTMTPHFLKGGEKLPPEAVAALMERWTHCLEEAEHRRLDLKKLQRRLPPL